MWKFNSNITWAADKKSRGFDQQQVMLWSDKTLEKLKKLKSPTKLAIKSEKADDSVQNDYRVRPLYPKSPTLLKTKKCGSTYSSTAPNQLNIVHIQKLLDQIKLILYFLTRKTNIVQKIMHYFQMFRDSLDEQSHRSFQSR